jgi:hypothetical protein
VKARIDNSLADHYMPGLAVFYPTIKFISRDCCKSLMSRKTIGWGYRLNVNTALDCPGSRNGPAFMCNLPSARTGLWLLIGLLESVDVEFVHLKQCLHHSLRFRGVLVLQHLV